MDSQPDLIAKVEKLGRQFFWTKCVAAILFICLAVATVAGWVRHPKTVVANELILKDKAGNIVARLGQGKFGDTCLILTANQNVSGAYLCVQDEEGSYLDLLNMKSQSRATLTPGMYGHPVSFGPALVINQAANSHYMYVNVGTETKFVIGHDSKDFVTVSMPPGEPKITLFGESERPIRSTH